MSRALRTGKVVLVPDVAADPDYVTTDAGVLSEIVAPLVADGVTLGVLNVESRDRRLDRTDRDLVGAAASRVAGAIALGTDRQELADRVRLLRTLHTLGEDVSGTLVPGRLHEIIVERIADVVPATVVALTILDRTDGTYRVAHGTWRRLRPSGARWCPAPGSPAVRSAIGCSWSRTTSSATAYPAGMRDSIDVPLAHGVGRAVRPRRRRGWGAEHRPRGRRAFLLRARARGAAALRHPVRARDRQQLPPRRGDRARDP